MEIFKDKVSITDKITLGGDRMVLFAGPCAAESYDICFETGAKVKEICAELGIDYVFKSSFDKANRTSASSYRGPSKEDGLKIEMGSDWVHLRASNTEPIIRIYSESSTKTTAESINRKIMDDIKVIMK